jgi:hypothetical protein
VFRSATAAQQAELLDLAKRQGMLYGHQLPATPYGPGRDGVYRFLSRVLAGNAQDLTAARAAPVGAPSLDPGQREAVARALATPDICLIQGLPVSGKSRVAAEIAVRAAERGERVLLVAPRAASVDRVLELLDDRSAVCAVRIIGRDEQSAELPPRAASLVFGERVRLLHERALRAASRQKSEADQRCADLAAVASLWPSLLELSESSEQLDDRCNALLRRRQSLPDAVTAIAARLLTSMDRDSADAAPMSSPSSSSDSPFEVELHAAVQEQRQAAARLDRAISEAAARIQAMKDQLAGLGARLDELAPLAEAKAGRRWWTPAWWRATWRGDVAARAADLQARAQSVRQDLTRLEEEAARLGAERRQAEEKERVERAGRIEREIARRGAEVDREEATLKQESALVERKWREALSRIPATMLTPRAATVEAVREAHGAWQRNSEAAVERRALAAEWAQRVEAGPEFLAGALRAQANLIAAQTSAVTADPQFGDAVGGEPIVFDLLLVDHAEQLTEAEFTSLAVRCRRWVLIAESFTDGRAPSDTAVGPAEPNSAYRQGNGRRAKPPAPGFFQRLWPQLHCDPSRLPYKWQREADGRLCCRLRTVSPDQQRWIETERVADHPDVELRIVAPPRATHSTADSFLAEVVFPQSVSLLEAKSYVFRELQEVAVHARFPQARWLEVPDRLVLALADDTESPEHVSAMDLAPGVREVVAFSINGRPSGTEDWVTRAVEFDRAAGWERDRAEAWAARHLGLRDLGRTAILDAPQGYAPGLAPFLSDVLFDGGYRIGTSCPSPTAAPVEFIAVPRLSRGPTRGPQRRRKLPSGAGLETDPADPRRRDRLPSEMHARLGDASGLVNFLEAQAVVRALKGLANEHGGSRSKTSNPDSWNGSFTRPISVGVVALYPTQARLIRLLLAPESELLASAGLDVRVDEPAAFQERECAIALVSLTRSHTHRATSFGDDPAALARALTRGRARLLLFGDPGTLARRAEWHAPLDRLDEAASTRERGIVARLVQYLQGEGKHQHLFHVRDDNPNAGVASGRGALARGVAARESSNA